MKYFNVDFLAEPKYLCSFLSVGQLDSWMTNGPMSEQKVEISFLLLHAVNKSL